VLKNPKKKKEISVDQNFVKYIDHGHAIIKNK